MRVPPPQRRRSSGDKLATALGGIGCMALLIYFLLVIAFWVGVFLLVWKLALS